MKAFERWTIVASFLALTMIAGGADAQVFFSGGYVSISGSGPTKTAMFGPYENETPPPGPQVATVSIVDGATATSEVSESPLLVSAFAATVGVEQVQANAHLDYSLLVSGPTGQVSVPFTATLHTTGSSDPNHPYVSYYSATSTLRIGFAPGDPNFSACSSNETSCTTPGDAVISSSTLITANQAYTVDEVTSAQAEDYNASATATADPIFTLTEAEELAGYTLVITPGVANGAVPEPASWALMLGGLGIMGGALRRRRFRSA